ncbi:hypothetical protein FACS1894189_2440 [Planctomycetales bacterium]|nr:hypothetical protein FACS1894189_2440 [Planctomycetales bacterium]
MSIKPVVERIAVFAEGQGTVHGSVGTGKRQPPKTTSTFFIQNSDKRQATSRREDSYQSQN